MSASRQVRRAGGASLLVLCVISLGTASAQTEGAGCFNLTATIVGTNDATRSPGPRGRT